MTVPKAKLKQNKWVLDDVIECGHCIPERYFLETSPDVLKNFRGLLSRDVYSEGDSQVLYHYIQSRRLEMSGEFLRMMDLWLADELKHYEALRRVYHCISGISFAEMDRCFSSRVHDFSPVEPILEDEFTILVALMFDELGSVYSYRRDLKEYYQHFGPEVRKIGHHLVKDEGTHFNNGAELILTRYDHRLGEVKSLLKKISRLEDNLETYYKTFFLDHAQEQNRFPPEFNQVISQVILARLGLGTYPPTETLRQLWQWVPEGYSLVPIF